MESTDGILIEHREMPGNYSLSLLPLPDDPTATALLLWFHLSGVTVTAPLSIVPAISGQPRLWFQAVLGTQASVLSMGFSHCLFSPKGG